MEADPFHHKYGPKIVEMKDGRNMTFREIARVLPVHYSTASRIYRREILGLLWRPRKQKRSLELKKALKLKKLLILRRCVYIVHALTTDFYKIGMTIDFDTRLGTIRSTVPFWDIEIIAVHYCDNHRGLESYLHEIYSDKRLKNSEWFELSSVDVAALAVDTKALFESLGFDSDYFANAVSEEGFVLKLRQSGQLNMDI